MSGNPQLAEDSGASAGRNLGLGLCAFTLMLDGLDNQILGLVMPSLMADWGLERSTFTPFIIATVVLMSAGTSLGGWLGDRFGRKPILFASLALLGALTIASGLANNPSQLLVLRGLSALGMGGVMPNATALLAEYVSLRHRSLSVSLGVAAIPLGGVMGGVLGSIILPAFGWRTMFFMAGGITLLAAFVISSLLPESPALKTARSRPASPGRNEPGEAGYAPQEGPADHGGKQTIFSKALRRDTLALWCALFFSMLGVYSMINWVPTLLSQQGYGLSTASLGLALFNAGGILASVVVAAAMDRYGSRKPLLLTGLVGGLVAMAAIPALAPGNAPILAIVPLGAMGFFIAGMQAALIAFSAQVYPTAMRSTGMGAMMAFGRLGALASSVTGTVILGLGSAHFLAAMGATIVIAGFTSLLARSRAASPRPLRQPVAAAT
ncbi:MFS transporter [Novosphingobium pentaromativorans]|nr:MFS transporter [Novosphingobium pentaromativorans]